MKSLFSNNLFIIKALPSFFTISSLLLGLFAINMAIDNNPAIAIRLILIASIFDLLDGRLARMLKATSDFGGELDSLSDFTTFGVAPAFILYYCTLYDSYPLGWISCCFFIVAALLRLARFNVLSKTSTGYTNYFIGIPVPAGALLLFLPFYLSMGFNIVINNTYLIIAYNIAIALLMVSNIPTLSTKNLKVNKNFLPLFIALITLFILLLVYYTWIVLFFSAVIYIISIPITFITEKKNNKKSKDII